MKEMQGRMEIDACLLPDGPARMLADPYLHAFISDPLTIPLSCDVIVYSCAREQAYFCYSVVLTVFIYPVVVHWGWGSGFLSAWVRLDTPSPLRTSLPLTHPLTHERTLSRSLFDQSLPPGLSRFPLPPLNRFSILPPLPPSLLLCTPRRI